ncbi:threonine ammonia-lyase [Parasediminibacterium sp. JCM 36343]|uniref:threonine ammonia-lyase n=1 Tax=Parasediminibacterium sp. JCM 36343 TaxID=3374279 RepID=UPI00397D866F
MPEEKQNSISQPTNSPTSEKPSFDFAASSRRLANVVIKTPLQYNENLSRRYACSVYLKREDLQVARSYKLRGAYNMMSSLPMQQLNLGVVCASAGNHAQGVAYSCSHLGVKGVIFMPTSTPKQKILQTKMFGGNSIEVKLIGDTFDDCSIAAKQYKEAHNMVFIPAFDDERIIEGQGTVGVEILEQALAKGEPLIDYVFIPVGGGGLSAGIGSYFKKASPQTKIIGLEPEGAPSMVKALEAGQPVTLGKIDRFVDGAAVKRIGDVTFPICKAVIDEMHLVAEGKICTTILQLYNEDAIVVEPAGALAVACLDEFAEQIKGKKVVCVVSGGNNDIDRMPEIKERSLLYEGLKYYFLISFAQRPGALREFLNDVLGPDDDITRFEYIQKTNKESGPALVGIELLKRTDYNGLIERMKKCNIDFSEINRDDTLYGYLV